MKVRNWLISICVFLIWIHIPAVPVSWAPVIPDPIFRLTWLSIWRMVKVTAFPYPGMQYQFNINTALVIVLLIGTGFLARYLLLKYLHRFRIDRR